MENGRKKLPLVPCGRATELMRPRHDQKHAGLSPVHYVAIVSTCRDAAPQPQRHAPRRWICPFRAQGDPQRLHGKRNMVVANNVARRWVHRVMGSAQSSR